jgi:hypothetical protein
MASAPCPEDLVMSRFAVICSLVLGLSYSASTASAGFAKAPPADSPRRAPTPAERELSPTDVVTIGTHAQVPDMPDMPNYRVAPARPLDRANVRAALARARAANLAAFRVYQKKGVFPSNTYKKGQLNVWLDEYMHYCAAATIIKMSGQDALVAKVAEENNFIRLADVQQGPLMDWILTSGFTQAEIAMIQEPFRPVVEKPQLEPAKPILVDNQLRKQEDARLRAKYKKVDAAIVKAQRKSLDEATDRLMKNPALAWKLLAAQTAPAV